MPATGSVPPLACDCHMHVFGPPERFPGSATRAYTPTERSLSQYHAMADALGIARVVFVQPSAYGIDNCCMLETLAVRPAAYRGVAVIGDATSDDDLTAMDRAGVRGIRLNLVTEGEPDLARAESALTHAAGRISRLGWHLQIYASVKLLGGLAPVIRGLGVPVVMDHMAGASSAGDLDQPGLPAVLELIAAGKAWVKVSGADRVTDSSDAFGPATKFASALIAANSRHVVWGTDWPHLGHHGGGTGAAAPAAVYRDLDDQALLGILRASVPDEAVFTAILADNPARLYGF